ncbi:hypothetical protein FJT64_014655 [Amphibalanus amphitrite]|uniref:Uncharacterized protein n=1 Tax=Amphibalanus amphitrite TaxID=1232801 RepID=A0A6A4VB71_AMPAM|nr:hypothetical protein FJT64_014655 [Amphibalanus amphitrite]
MNLTMFGLGEPRRSSLTLEKVAFERRGSFADRLSAEAAAHRRGSTEMLDRLRDARLKLFDKERFKDRRGSLSQERLDQRPPAGRAAGLKLEESGTRTLDRDKTGRRSLRPEIARKLEDEKTRTLDRDKTGRRVKVERRGSIVTRWYRLIKEAADSYQGRDGKGHKRTESAHTLLQAQDSSEAAPTPAPAAADEPADSAAAPAGAEAALSPGATSPPDASPAASPTAPRSQLTAKAAAGETARHRGYSELHGVERADRKPPLFGAELVHE